MTDRVNGEQYVAVNQGAGEDMVMALLVLMRLCKIAMIGAIGFIPGTG